MNSFIRFDGFSIGNSGRLYNFTVGNPTDGQRQVTVGIPFLAFAPAQLKFQDGPQISLRKVRDVLGLDPETSGASSALTISNEDIATYLFVQHPVKAIKRKRPAEAPDPAFGAI